MSLNWPETFKDEEIELNDSRTEFICTTCEANWEKTNMKTKPPCSFQIRQGSKFSVERHMKSKKHKNCMKASDSFQLNKNYYA